MRGRAIVLETDTVIRPFSDPAAEAFFTHETLRETQARAFGRLGLEVVHAKDPVSAAEAIARAPRGPVLLVLDRVYVSEKAAKDFLRAARRAARPAALALTRNASVEYTLPLQDVRVDPERVVHDVVLVDGASLPPPRGSSLEWMREIQASATPVDVPKRELVAEVLLPTVGEGERAKLRYPITSTVVVSVEHWVHILWLNQIAFGIRWMELLRRRPLWGLWRAISALSLNRHRLLDRLVWRGRGADVHPTAHLSASILGDGVKIGAHVTIRNSIVGDGAVIQDHSVLLNTVVGPRTLVTENTFLVSTAIYPDATVGNYKLQVTLVGRGAYLNNWASFVDARFAGDVKVHHKGALVGTERAFLGSCVGHRARIAAKVLIQPGREIPNDTVVVMRPDEVISDIPADLPPNTPLVRDRGTLVPLGQESQSP